MKIGLIRQRYTASGGAERYLDALIKELNARGHQIHLFAANWPGGSNHHFTFHHVPIIRMGSFFKALSFAFMAKRVVAQAGCDLVLSLERTLRQDVYRAGDGCHREWLEQRRKYVGPTKRAALSASAFHRLMLALEQRTFSPQRTQWIIANSQQGKDEIVRHYHFPAERITVIYNGVDLQRFTPSDTPWNERAGNLLFVGTGFERKGLDFCLRGLAALPASYSLQIVGKGNIKHYSRMAERLGVANRVKFLGHNLDMPRVFERAGMLLHPAIYEPFANACLEAMASGIPPVVARSNGVAEILHDGVDGAILPDPSNTEALAHAVMRFRDEDRWREASRATRRTAESFPFARNVSETLELLEKASISTRHLAMNP